MMIHIRAKIRKAARKHSQVMYHAGIHPAAEKHREQNVYTWKHGMEAPSRKRKRNGAKAEWRDGPQGKAGSRTVGEGRKKERKGKAEPRAGKLSGPEGGRSREAVGAGKRSGQESSRSWEAVGVGRLSGLEGGQGWKEVGVGRRSGLEGGRGWKAVGGRSQERGEDRKREGKGRSRKQKLWTVKQWTVRSPRSRCGWRRPPARRYSYSPSSRGCWPGACRPCASK